jgi:hypothetical protein
MNSRDSRNKRELERERKEVLVTFIRGLKEMRGISESTRKILFPKGEFLSESVRDVLNALEGNLDPLARVLALDGLYLLAIGLLRLGIQSGGEKIEAQKRDQMLQSLMQARDAKRPASKAIEDAIAHRAAPFLEKHPKYTSHRIANLIFDEVNADLGTQKITQGAIRKRLQKSRTVR